LLQTRCILSIAVLAALGACKPAPAAPNPASPQPPESERPTAVSSIKSAAPNRPSVSPPAEIWKEFSGEKAFDEARKQVEIGPRPSGSAELEKARVLIEESLRQSGWDIERQAFTDDTPHGPVKFVNIIARFSPNGVHPAASNTQRAIVCSHYDTKVFSTIRFVGASDGASSTGALLELARVLALDPAMASQIELVFFDGEEAVVQFTDPSEPKADGLYGSRYYARQLGERARQFKFGILWDMIGDRDLTITIPPDAPSTLSRGILGSAEALGVRQNFGFFSRTILDDHEPLLRVARIPTIDLIDFDYVYWHTAEDTLEHIAPESLQKVGAVTLHYLRQGLGK
jgi:glutaminyl-peptide cyclotransferase